MRGGESPGGKGPSVSLEAELGGREGEEREMEVQLDSGKQASGLHVKTASLYILRL